MESKLTLKLNTNSIRQAKHYIKVHQGNSLSKLVEKYFNSLTSPGNEAKEIKLPPIVAGLAGIAGKHKKGNEVDAYTDYLIEKYK